MAEPRITRLELAKELHRSRGLEERPIFLREPGDEGFPPPTMRDPVTRDERVTTMPALRDEPRVFRDLGDCLSLLGIGMFIGAVLTKMLEWVVW